GLNDLVGLADACTDDAHRVFQCDARNVCVQQHADEIQRQLLLLALVLEPARSTHAKVCAWWMKDREVPPGVKNAQYVALDMVVGVIVRRHEVTCPCSM